MLKRACSICSSICSISSLSKTLDLFGGTGAISYELASRGAADLTIIEKDTNMFAFIRNTVKQLGLDQIHPVKSDVFRFMESCGAQYDFIFAGPPYALQQIDDLPLYVFRFSLLRPGGVFVLEHTPRNDYQTHPNFFRMKNYWYNRILLFQTFK
ncbi:MAG: RsmD family RNA methyltransferase [Chitinophagaceae bacterium]